MIRVLLFVLLLMPLAARADVTIAPGQRTTTETGGTITLGNTFQSAAASDTNRTGCAIQNTSSHTLYVFFGPTASATTSNSFQISPTTILNCSSLTGIALTDNIAVTTSTTSDTFVLAIQR